MGGALLRRLLAHPLTASLAPDDPRTTELRREIIESKPFLKAIYQEWYARIVKGIPPGEGQVLELGSGAGFLSDYLPELITSEIFLCPRISLAMDAQEMPFGPGALRAVVMTDVLHHMPNVRRFFSEAKRCVRSGGKLLMIEPWVTSWSRFIYCNFHAEPFLPEAKDWEFASSGPLSGANGALPWILFERDRRNFESEFPEFEIREIRPFMPFRYLVSGGVSMRNLMPGFTHGAWAALENRLQSQMRRLAMFVYIEIVRR